MVGLVFAEEVAGVEVNAERAVVLGGGFVEGFLEGGFRERWLFSLTLH